MTQPTYKDTCTIFTSQDNPNQYSLQSLKIAKVSKTEVWLSSLDNKTSELFLYWIKFHFPSICQSSLAPVDQRGCVATTLIVVDVRQHRRLNICSYIGWINKYCISYFLVNLSLSCETDILCHTCYQELPVPVSVNSLTTFTDGKHNQVIVLEIFNSTCL